VEDFITIKLAVQGNGSIPYRVHEDTTIGELKELAKMNPHLEIRVNSETVDDDFVVKDGATVIATQPVKGGVA
jgi:hypothetical protein